MPAKKKVAPEFTTVRNWIKRYTVLPDDELDIATVWAMGTWCFSPRATKPATYPYLYVAAAKGSGKTVFGSDVMGSICRTQSTIVNVTGPALFRMLALFDDETGTIFDLAPTLSIDEVDAAYSGARDEDLRSVLNAGYKRGATIPRAAGKVSINYPVYCPKILMGIDNGHLPETVTDRSIRIDMKRATPEEMDAIEEFYPWDTEEEAAEIQAMLADWALENSLVLRDYRPEKIEGFRPRQWEIARSLVQLASAIGNEAQIRAALHRVMTKDPEAIGGKPALYRAIFNLFSTYDVDRVTTRQILEALDAAGVSVPGNSGKGLSSVLSEEGIAPDYIRLGKLHPAFVEGENPIQRGYFRHKFDGAFIRFLDDDDAETAAVEGK